MEDFSKFIEYNGCATCIANSANSCKYCEKYEKKFKVNSSQSVKFQNTELDKYQRVPIQKFSNITASKFRNFYCTDRRDVSFWSQMRYQRFSSIEHLTSYILSSNNIQPSQLAGESKWDLGKLPQIKHLVSINENLLANTQNIHSQTAISNSNDLAIQHIYNPSFWAKLIKLYIIHFHRTRAVFYLKDFDLSTISQSLLNAIYCLGYLYFDQKSDELTEYMNQLREKNFHNIKLKPSLTNIQALFIHQNIIYHQGKVSEARAILLHITKMCYILGLHRNTKKVSQSVFYARNLTYTRVLYSHLIMNKVFKVNLNFQVDNPDINKVCYGVDWQFLPKETSRLIQISQEERSLISTLTTLNIEHRDKSLFQLIFPNIDSYTNEQIYKLCLSKYSNLCLSHSRYVRGYELLSNNFPEYSKLIAFDRDEFETYYLHMGILIFEYGKSKSKGVNYRLVYKMASLCDKLMNVALTSDIGHFFEFRFYLTVFTYLVIFRHLKRSHQNKILSNLTMFKKVLIKYLSRSNLLIYLLFDKGVEMIKS
ncbi:hypothetical protein CONCODRAFT_16203 [Conidiobolus coronatus NRRL 28638]|uniref:Transcription factor domain-containing protein n=1 Tax=Conidiobolus coronatus (strain ATCC 28846 / CBS 209.66 / NRRL 28638) TaxID=796925 RepID=A0A137PBQ1_CONC2|nr:hypothetical protein CONCODRAFT_16203 [Conidiobolus coronatus NRRL 28638]|eukprot:KXN72361.1 hypothetical protein CONCODRAFT_16203 [Conidiobolus coronatus NRRL 28638]